MEKTMASPKLRSAVVISVIWLLAARVSGDTDPLDCTADDDVLVSPATGTLTCAPQDREALLQFKAAVMHDPKHALASWRLSNANCCSWEGIICDGASGRVAGLKLPQAGLRGTLSEGLGALSYLQVLTLYENSFSGGLPRSLGTLTRLRKLCLSSNGLSGSIPASFGGMTSLQMLDLSYNSLSGALPTYIGEMSSLQHIRIYRNHISGVVPRSFGRLSSLFNADLALNQLSGRIPNAFNDNLTSLAFLFLDHNRISGFPAKLSNLRSLQWVSASFNPSLTIAGVAGLLTAPQLVQLDLSNCQLSGSFPTSFVARLPRANTDFLSDEVTPSLDLSNNHLSGGLPSNLGDLLPDYTQGLSISNNRLVGSIPSSLGKLTTMRFLSLDRNHFTGGIPASFANLQSLLSFNVSYNRLSGLIPQVSPFTSFDASSYAHNVPGLCGSPLPSCTKKSQKC